MSVKDKALAVSGNLLLICSFLMSVCFAQDRVLTASWYSIESLKREGTYKLTKGVMANGKVFNENDFTCATRLWHLGTVLTVTNMTNGRTVIVKVTDRIGKRFAKTRIDLSKSAFEKIANRNDGIVRVIAKEMSNE